MNFGPFIDTASSGGGGGASGHAAYNPAKETGELYLENEEGDPVPLSADELCALLVKKQLKLVVLSACQTARTGGQQAFDSVATALLREPIPAVLAMQFRIADTSAIEISKVFYSQLILERSVIEVLPEPIPQWEKSTKRISSRYCLRPPP